MDAALILKQKFDSGEITDFNQASYFLNKSDILRELLSDFEFDILNLVNRLTEIKEIPFAYQIDRVQKWVSKLADLSFCGDGFSITGKRDDILSCYNSMIVSILINMRYPDEDRILKGINWIVRFQNLERGAINNWNGSRMLKYGGCMKSTPCYIGVVKATIALSDYIRKANNQLNEVVESKLKKGLNYILDHQIYIRKSNNQPITKDIEKLTFPFSYKTNVIEILRLLRDNNLDSDSRCDSAKEYLKTKRNKTGFWQVNSSYKPKCWVHFDKPGETGLWVSHEITKIFN